MHGPLSVAPGDPRTLLQYENDFIVRTDAVHSDISSVVAKQGQTPGDRSSERPGRCRRQYSKDLICL
ncbi:hypothetical protein PFLUV_G00211130 [Perca fluviatilis]|uniref:Uncharacterized protein n=1 Tax=Perca fluviatilis TaxID=8168 RepID=A0A6A5DSM8_PERFL|nr:hypothetical protein PFLUV_G00211130 [Perca fluviatilis]